MSVLFADLAGFTGFSEDRPASEVVEMLNRYWAAALAIRSEADRLAADRSSWPRFRIAVNTGPAMVGNVGADLQRSFTVIGDTINLAARLQATAPPGEVVIGPTTWEDLGDQATVVPLGPAELRGKREPVPVYRLVSVTG